MKNILAKIILSIPLLTIAYGSTLALSLLWIDYKTNGFLVSQESIYYHLGFDLGIVGFLTSLPLALVNLGFVIHAIIEKRWRFFILSITAVLLIYFTGSYANSCYLKLRSSICHPINTEHNGIKCVTSNSITPALIIKKYA